MENITTVMSVETLPPVEVSDITFTVIQMSYGVPSWLLMVYFLFFLRHYPNSFYRLVQLDLLTNIFCYLNTFVMIRFSHYPFGIIFTKSLESLFPGSLTFSNILINFFLHMQFCSAISLSIHRVTVAVFAVNYNKFWSRWYIAYGVTCVLYSFLPTFLIPGKIATFEIDNGTLLYIKFTERTKYSDYTTASLTFLYFVLLFLVGISTSVLVRKRVREFNFSDQGVARKLTMVAVTYCALYSGILLWTIVAAANTALHFFPSTLLEYSFNVLVMTSDMMTLALPYILIFFDSNVRRDLLRRTQVEVVPVLSSSL